MITLLALMLAAPAPADIAGTWKTENGKALVRIAPCGPAWCGSIARLLVAPPPGKSRDVNNPDAALRSRPILGLTILSGFMLADGKWRGTIYDPEHGKTYRSVLRKQADGTLQVKGCVAIFCKTQIWRPAR